MSVFEIISMLGGLGFFLYGMSLLGSGLKSAAGGRLEEILGRLSSTPVKGTLLGLFVTAVIQSSSATSVMVIGFVNSGILGLTQAIGVVLGSKVGTTVTGWLLSLNQIQLGQWLKLLQPSVFSSILALIGAAIILFSKKQKRKQYATILLGFAILMTGMSTMSGAAEPLKENPEFLSLLTAFSNPFLGILVGIVITAILQSASASVGILQALALTGAINYSAAIPLVLGMSIGASVPVLLSGIGASRDGKRVSLIYLLISVAGMILVVPFYYLALSVWKLPILNESANAVGIAVFNSAFSLITTIVLLPFVRLIGKLSVKIIPSKEKDEEQDISELLEERFLAYPEYALLQCKNVIDYMSDHTVENIRTSIKLLHQYDSAGAESVEQNEAVIDALEDKLGAYLIKISARDLRVEESRTAAEYLHTIGDLERIADHAENLAERAKEIEDKNVRFSPAAQHELDVLMQAIEEILLTSVQSFRNQDNEAAERVEPIEQVIDLMTKTFKQNHVTRLQRGTCNVNDGFVFNDILTDFERVSDHCSNMAASVIMRCEDRPEMHSYLTMKKEADEGVFHALFEEYKEKYYDAALAESAD